MPDQDDHRSGATVPMVALWWSPSEDEARLAARSLVEHGIGAAVAPAPSEIGQPGFEVRVLADEAARAAVLLRDDGVIDALDVTATEPSRARSSWKAVVVIWLVAMMVLPTVAGVATYLLTR
jgi:hypothetical protein